MNFYVLSLFPDVIEHFTNAGVLGRGKKNNLVNIHCIDIRDFSKDKHRKADDYPYGGGFGMVLSPEPIYYAFESVKKQIPQQTKVIYLTPQGKTLNQKMVQDLSKETDIVLLCGHYEGVDERVIEEIVTDEVSAGDYILSGGEIAALALIDSVARLVPGVLGNENSAGDESFSDGLLEFPQYTRPSEFLEKKVPDILLSGHHENIKKWRREKSLERTFLKRKELLINANLSDEDLAFINTLQNRI